MSQSLICVSIIGGVFTNTTMCDVPNVYAMHNMDLGKQNPDSAPWYQFRPNLTTYKVPPEIVSAIGGSYVSPSQTPHQS